MKYVLYLFLAAALAFAARYLFSISEWTKTADLARKADAIKVYTVEKRGNLLERIPLFESTNPKDIAEFAAAMKTKKTVARKNKKQLGLPLIYLYRKGEELMIVSNHDGNRISSSKCKTDSVLKSPEKWRAWFASRIPNFPTTQTTVPSSEIKN